MGCGSVIKAERVLMLPHPEPQESDQWALRRLSLSKDSDGQGGRGANSFSLAE